MSIGIDVVEVARLKSSLDRCPEMEARMFTSAEREYCARTANPLVHLAGTLAAKEAVMKALDLTPLVVWARKIEIIRERSGAPTVRCESAVNSTSVQVSISHDGPVAVAVAVKRSHHEPEDLYASLGPWLDKVIHDDPTGFVALRAS